jgi:small-conductance mechanosensitive channel
MTMTQRLGAAAIAVLIALAAAEAGAQSLISQPQETVAAKPRPNRIAAESGADEDQHIAARIARIFSQLPELRGVQVRVAAGVVTLRGTVPNADAIDRAEEIAGRVAGVVTVQNDLARNLGVSKNLSPAVSGVVAKLRGLAQGLPLLAIAILAGVLVVMLGYALARQKRWWLKVTPNPFLAELMVSALRFLFIVIGIILALEILDATALLGAVLGGAGVIGIAIGFAVRDSIDNYISSLLLSIRQPFRGNDSVKIDDYEGRVVRLHSRATVLMTFDGNHLRLPNALVFKAVITNYSRNPKRRFNFDVPIDHNADPCRARSVGTDALKGLEFVLEDPAPVAELAELAGTSIVLRFHGWVDQTHTDFAKARTAAIEAVRSGLRQAGLVYPDTRYVIKLEQQGEEQPAPEEEQPTVDNVAPENHVAEMVSEERANDEGQDLLDHTQPEE